jgi:hypothetical protein
MLLAMVVLSISATVKRFEGCIIKQSCSFGRREEDSHDAHDVAAGRRTLASALFFRLMVAKTTNQSKHGCGVDISPRNPFP